MAEPRKPEKDEPAQRLPHETGAPCPAPESADDPFATFVEWASEVDEAGYADL